MKFNKAWALAAIAAVSVIGALANVAPAILNTVTATLQAAVNNIP